jgi:hypothetical protein
MMMWPSTHIGELLLYFFVFLLLFLGTSFDLSLYLSFAVSGCQA